MRFEISPWRNARSCGIIRVKRTPMPRNFLWSERLRSSDQTIWALHGMNRPFTSRTKGRLWLEFNSFDKRMNAPPRLRSSVFPSGSLDHNRPSDPGSGVAAVINFHSLLRRAIYGRILSRTCSEGLGLLPNLQECLEKMQQKNTPLTSPATKANGARIGRSNLRTLTSPDISCQSESFLAPKTTLHYPRISSLHMRSWHLYSIAPSLLKNGIPPRMAR
jgi:hypothetical protein